MTTTIRYEGIPAADATALRTTLTDCLGNRLEPFRDEDGGWPLRCCLSLSQPGDELVITAYSPLPWRSPYRETGPIVIHRDECGGHDGRFPVHFADGDQVVRVYGRDSGRERTQVYELNRWVSAGEGLQEHIAAVLEDPRVEFVQGRSVLAGCYNFTARRG